MPPKRRAAPPNPQTEPQRPPMRWPFLRPYSAETLCTYPPTRQSRTGPPRPRRGHHAAPPAHYLPSHPRPTVPPGRGAQSRPRLAPGLNGPGLTTPPALGIARPGAASRPVWVPFHMTGFDGFLRIVGRCSGRQGPGGAFKWSNMRWFVALGQLLGQLPHFSGNLQAMARLSG